MTRSFFTHAAIAGALIVSGCSGNNTSPAPQPTTPVVSGEYSGTVTDSVHGNGTAAVTPLSQHGGALGGTLASTFGATAVTQSLALAIGTNGSITGNALGSDASGNTCAFNVTGSYTASSNQLSGTYTAFSGCSGQNGSFTLTQQCSDPANAVARRNPLSGGIPAC